MTISQKTNDPNTPSEQLRELCQQNPSLEEMLLLAKHPNMPPDLLTLWSKHQNTLVQKAVLENPNTPFDTVAHLGEKYPDFFLKNPAWSIWLLENPNLLEQIPEATLEAIISLPWIQDTIKIYLLSLQSKEGPKEWEEAKNLSPLFVQSLAQTPSIRAWLAIRPDTSLSMLNILAKDSDFSVRSAVAENQETPREILGALAKDEEPNVRAVIALRRDTPEEALQDLANDPDYMIRRLVAENANASSKLLEKLSKDQEIKVRRAVAGNTNTPKYVLSLLSKDKEMWVRHALTENSSTPRNVLQLLSKDEEDEIRRFARENPNLEEKKSGFVKNWLKIFKRRFRKS